MKKHDFIPFTFEWWHYDYVGWEKYPPLGVSFDSLARGAKSVGRTRKHARLWRVLAGARARFSQRWMMCNHLFLAHR